MEKRVAGEFMNGLVRWVGIAVGMFAVAWLFYVANWAGWTLPNVLGWQQLTSSAWNDLVGKVNDLESRSAPNLAYSASYSTTSWTDTVTLTRTGMVYAETWSHDSSTWDAITTIVINGVDCSKDRMYFWASTNSYSQWSCTRILPAWTHTVTTSASWAQWRKRTVWAIEF